MEEVKEQSIIAEQELTFSQKLGAKFKKINPKSAIKIITCIFGLTFIVVETVVGATLDPTKLDFFTWFSNSMILIAIMIFGMLMGESIGEDSQKSRVGGLYQTSLNSYYDFRRNVEDINYYLDDYLEFKAEDIRKNAEIRYLLAHRIKDAYFVVNYVDKQNIEELKNHAINPKENVYIAKKNEEEIEVIKEILNGKFLVKHKKASYYLGAFEDNGNTNVLEMPFKLERDEKNNKRINRAVKIVSSIIISLTFSMITVKEIMSGEDMQARTNLVLRVLSFFSSLFSGYLTSSIGVKILARIIHNKELVLREFRYAYDNKIYVPTDYQKLAEEEYKNFIKEEKGKEEQCQVKEEQVSDNNNLII